MIFIENWQYYKDLLISIKAKEYHIDQQSHTLQTATVTIRNLSGEMVKNMPESFNIKPESSTFSTNEVVD